jgi:hypothetical protein
MRKIWGVLQRCPPFSDIVTLWGHKQQNLLMFLAVSGFTCPGSVGAGLTKGTNKCMISA